MKRAVLLAKDNKNTDKKTIERQSQTHFHLAHYADALFRSHEERLASNEWQAATRLRKHKVLFVCVCVCVCEKQNVFHAFVDFTDNRTGSTNQTTEKFIKGKL